MTDGRLGTRMLVDVAVYAFARLLLVAVLTGVVYAVGTLVAGQFPLVIAMLFALIVAFPLGIWVFAPLRRRATASMAAFDERRRTERAQLRSRLRGDDAPSG